LYTGECTAKQSNLQVTKELYYKPYYEVTKTVTNSHKQPAVKVVASIPLLHGAREEALSCWLWQRSGEGVGIMNIA